MDSIHLEISGRVQGVGFRWFVQDEARELGLAGWVRNKPDGNVELAAGGNAQSLQEFAARVRRGPPGARVDNAKELPPVSAESLPRPFAITR